MYSQEEQETRKDVAVTSEVKLKEKEETQAEVANTSQEQDFEQDSI